ncbi:nuclear transport factor 2 family protein [Shewanella sp. 125m-1]
MPLSNKEKAIALLNSIQSGSNAPIAYINPNKYIQHNLDIADGLAGFGAVMKNAPAGGFKVKVVRAFEDGDYVFTHSDYDFFGEKIGIDIFRFEDGLIVEHWDNLIAKSPQPNPSGHTQIDGETKITDFDKTDANKATAKGFITTVLVGQQFDQAPNFVDANNYTQHHPDIADNLSGLAMALQHMGENGIHMLYDVNHITLGEGNFTLAVSEGNFAGNPTAYFDLLRLDNGKIVEHWGVMSTIPDKSEWKNDNGKFGFK